MEDIPDTGYIHAKEFVKTLKLKNLGEYHDLYLKNDTLLLVDDVFENFEEMCSKIYHIEPGIFLSAPGIACKAALKNTEIKSELLTDIDMLLMVEKACVKQFIDIQKLIINI